MKLFSPSENSLWETPTHEQPVKLSDEEINEKYSTREWRIVTEANREQLPNFVEALKRPGWMELRPFYQRRARWGQERQSRLIESFIMNIPVPPLFVFESDFAKYEVMDGQQRITAIRDFYSNGLRLKGLDQWPELNGRTYSKLPSAIKKGIDRRSISYIVLMKESAETTEEETLLRQMVFERLNTGGISLSQQEIRNCLYQGEVNTMLFELSKNPIFRTAFGLVKYSKEEDKNLPEELEKNTFYSKMGDVEMILRFFALRHANHYVRGMKGFLDLYMVRSRGFGAEDLKQLKGLFEETIQLGADIFGKNLFRPWNIKTSKWAEKAQVAFYDAVMVGLARNLKNGSKLRKRQKDVVEKIRELFISHEPGTFTGRGNSKSDVKERIDLVDKMLEKVAAS